MTDAGVSDALLSVVNFLSRLEVYKSGKPTFRPQAVHLSHVPRGASRMISGAMLE